MDFLKKHKILSHVYTIVIVWVGWALFAFDDMGRVIQYMKAMFGLSGAGFANKETLYLLISYGVMLLILIFASTCKKIYSMIHFNYKSSLRGQVKVFCQSFLTGDIS